MSIARLYILLACHMLGDYVFQSDFLARTKGENWWHMAAHCVLYTVPFAAVFGIDGRICWLLASHVLIDTIDAYEQVWGWDDDWVILCDEARELGIEVGA